MSQSVDFKTNFNTSKLISIWLVLLAVLMSSGLILWLDFTKGFAIFVAFINVVICVIIVYVKIGLKIVIRPQESVMEYHYIKLWGGSRQVSIDLKNAYVNLDVVTYRFNDLWNLTVSNHGDLKISLTEKTYGFDGRQINSMYQALKQVGFDGGSNTICL